MQYRKRNRGGVEFRNEKTDKLPNWEGGTFLWGKRQKGNPPFEESRRVKKGFWGRERERDRRRQKIAKFLRECKKLLERERKGCLNEGQGKIHEVAGGRESP